MRATKLGWMLFGISVLFFPHVLLGDVADADGDKRLAELDAYWVKVSQAVGSGDFKAYESTCHKEAVLVSGSKKMSQPLTEALARWKKAFDDTKSGKMKASVEFRFGTRLGDRTTAHESGMFCYSSGASDSEMKSEFIHFEALLVKRDGGWKILMEYQKSKGSKQEWQALAGSGGDGAG